MPLRRPPRRVLCITQESAAPLPVSAGAEALAQLPRPGELARLLLLRSARFHFDAAARRRHPLLWLAMGLLGLRYTLRSEILRLLKAQHATHEVMLLCGPRLYAVLRRAGPPESSTLAYYVIPDMGGRGPCPQLRYAVLYARCRQGRWPVQEAPLLLILDGCLNLWLLRTLRLMFPSARIVSRVHREYDELQGGGCIRQETYLHMLALFCAERGLALQSSSRRTARRCRMAYHPSGLCSARLPPCPAGPVRSVLFAGRCPEMRVRFVLSASQLLLLCGVQVTLWLADLPEEHAATCRRLQALHPRLCRLHLDGLPDWERCLELFSQCAAVLDPWRLHPDEGYSLRMAAALLSGRRIITNRSCLRGEDFYDPQQIYVADRASGRSGGAAGLQEFLNRPGPLPSRAACLELQDWLEAGAPAAAETAT